MGKFWYNYKNLELAQAVVSTADAIRDEQADIYEKYRRNAETYTERFLTGLELEDQQSQQNNFYNTTTGSIPDLPVTYNVSRVCGDTLNAKISAHRPKSKVITNMGSEIQQQKAKDSEKFISAIISKEKVYKKTQKALHHCIIYGMGVIKTSVTDDGVAVDNIHPDRIVVDNQACLDQDPVEIFYMENKPKDQVLAMFPNHERIIDEAHSTSTKSKNNVRRETIKVYEVYRKTLGKTIGRHIICINNGVLLDEEYDSKILPFSIIRFADDILGFYGLSLYDQIFPIQVEINKTAYKIQRNMLLLSVPYILKHKSSNIPDKHLKNNKEARMIEWEGQIKPEVVIPPAVHPQVFTYLEELYAKAFQITGISQMSASGQKSAGLNAAIAIRTMHDIETQRFAPLSQAWDELHVDISKSIIRAAKQIAEVQGYTVRYQDSMGLQELTFEDIDLDDDQMIIDVYPSSSLPSTPAGKLEWVTELINSGMVPPRVGVQMLNFTDLEKYVEMESANVDILEQVFETILLKQKYIEPIEVDDLPLGIMLGIQKLQKARLNKINGAEVSDKGMGLILQWLQEATALQNKVAIKQATIAAQAQQIAQPQPQQAAPQPIAPPTQ